MIDYLFISPLGWSRHIWDKITTDKRFSNKSFEIVEFLNDSFENISEELISKCISDNLNKLSPEGVVITSSFGTIALISTLINSNISMNRLILIDGFDIIPSSEELNNIFSDVKDGYYQQLSDYYDSILSDNEKEDLELLNILNYNLTVENDVYTPKLDIKSTVSYLSIYSNRDIEKSFLSISDKVSSFSIFSKLPISIPHTAIREENHLLMLKEPKELLGAIFQSD
ncbi:MAG: hypothetical protein E7I81_04295 [Streptococcus mitis]|jgi:hypothetical protein|nr:hypothetical protein [Streptococcus mitis]